MPALSPSGHLRGIRAIALVETSAAWAGPGLDTNLHRMNDRYLVSAEADQAIVVWEHGTGAKIALFGPQRKLCARIHLVHEMSISVTVDGVIRAFDISKRQMVAQHRLSELRSEQGARADHECHDSMDTRQRRTSGCVLLVWGTLR